MLDENSIVQILCKHLENAGYAILQQRTTDEQGIDIIARRSGQAGRLLIEVKGSTSSKPGTRNFGRPFSSAQILNRVGKALYKAAWMDSEDRNADDRVGIAFPDLDEYRRLLYRIKPVISKLGWDVFFVSRDKVSLQQHS